MYFDTKDTAARRSGPQEYTSTYEYSQRYKKEKLWLELQSIPVPQRTTLLRVYVAVPRPPYQKVMRVYTQPASNPLTLPPTLTERAPPERDSAGVFFSDRRFAMCGSPEAPHVGDEAGY